MGRIVRSRPILPRPLALRVAATAPELAACVAALPGGAQAHGFVALGAVGRFGGGHHRAALLAVALGEARGGELFPVTTILDDVLLQARHQAVQQVVGLVDQADQAVGAFSGIFMVQPTGIIRVGQLSVIGHIGHVAHGQGFGVVLVPLAVALLAQVVLVVQEQFILAGAGHVHQLQFAFGAGGVGAAALADVLAAAARRAGHLVTQLVAADELLAERHRSIVDHRGGLEGPQFAETTAWPQAAVLLAIGWWGAHSTGTQGIRPQLLALPHLPTVRALVNGNDALRGVAHEGEQGGVFGFHW